MTRDEAVAIMLEGLGNRTAQSVIDACARRLLDAQADLESGKTLPRFLLQENQALTLLSGQSTVSLPDRFLRIETDPHYTPFGTTEPFFVQGKSDYQAAVIANSSTDAVGPKVYVIRNGVIDFINTANQDYNLVWSYYKGAAPLSTGATENEWLADFRGVRNPAATWLIGEAGLRQARFSRDAPAVDIFTEMLTRGRAATFANILAEEASHGPMMMGANL